MAEDGCWEFLTFLNYVRLGVSGRVVERKALTPEAERKEMLDFSFRHWKQHSPYLKGLSRR